MAAETQSGANQPANQPKKRTRIMIDVSPELRRRIKLAAAREDVTIREYLERILEAAVPATERDAEQPARPLTWDAVNQLRAIQETISRAHPGVIYEDSADVVQRMREERAEPLGQL